MIMAKPAADKPRIFANHSDAQIADEWGLVNARWKNEPIGSTSSSSSLSAAVSLRHKVGSSLF